MHSPFYSYPYALMYNQYSSNLRQMDESYYAHRNPFKNKSEKDLKKIENKNRMGMPGMGMPGMGMPGMGMPGMGMPDMRMPGMGMPGMGMPGMGMPLPIMGPFSYFMDPFHPLNPINQNTTNKGKYIANSLRTNITQSRNPNIISFDFDGVLHTDIYKKPGLNNPTVFNDINRLLQYQNYKMINFIKNLDFRNNIVHIVTARSQDNLPIIQGFLARVGLSSVFPQRNIHFTNGQSKSPYLRNINATSHYDDSPNVISEIRRNLPAIQVITV